MSDPILSAIAAVGSKLDALAAHLGLGAKPSAAGAQATAQGGDVADDADLSGPYGNPEVRLPQSDRWEKWRSYDRVAMSDCPPELLREYARLLEWKAGKDEAENKLTSSGKPTAPLQRRDAARARGWAARLASAPQAKRAIGAQPLAPDQMSDDRDGDIPF